MNMEIKSDLEEYVYEIAEHVSSELRNTLDISTVRWVSRPEGKSEISDATLAFYIDGKRYQDNIVLLVSNYQFPHVVDEDIGNAQAISRLLQSGTQRNVAKPIFTGSYGIQSYAVFNRLLPLSDNRLVRYFQKKFTFKPVADWLLDLAIQTQRNCVDECELQRRFAEPIQFILCDSDMPSEIKRYVEKDLSEALREGLGLFTVAEHGDFWTGNVLFRRQLAPIISPFMGDFRVIDWRGSNTHGYPCCDLVRYCLSFYRPGSKSAGSAIRKYNSMLEISEVHFGLYIFASLGRLGMNLDQFPKDRYIALCKKYFEFIKFHGFVQTP